MYIWARALPPSPAHAHRRRVSCVHRRRINPYAYTPLFLFSLWLILSGICSSGNVQVDKGQSPAPRIETLKNEERSTLTGGHLRPRCDVITATWTFRQQRRHLQTWGQDDQMPSSHSIRIALIYWGCEDLGIWECSRIGVRVFFFHTLLLLNNNNKRVRRMNIMKWLF